MLASEKGYSAKGLRLGVEEGKVREVLGKGLGGF